MPKFWHGYWPKGVFTLVPIKNCSRAPCSGTKSEHSPAKLLQSSVPGHSVHLHPGVLLWLDSAFCIPSSAVCSFIFICYLPKGLAGWCSQLVWVNINLHKSNWKPTLSMQIIRSLSYSKLKLNESQLESVELRTLISEQNCFFAVMSDFVPEEYWVKQNKEIPDELYW